MDEARAEESRRNSSTKVLERELAKKPEELREPLREAYRTEVKKRTPEQLKLLKAHPTVNQLSAGSLYLYDRTYDTKHDDELKKFTDQAAEIRKRKPLEEFVPAFSEPRRRAAARHIPLLPRRSSAAARKAGARRAYRPRELPPDRDPRERHHASDHRPPPGVGAEPHRRQAPAHHPRARQSRVAPSFRARHRRLARRFRASSASGPRIPSCSTGSPANLSRDGWSMKKLHRLILTSSAYRQSSARDASKGASRSRQSPPRPHERRAGSKPRPSATRCSP